jgi:predicted 2-oxoglutarate/Fe(II)-dependent dioxygenase YbiX
MTSPHLVPGDKLPPCYGIGSDRSFYVSEEQYGRPAALLLAGSDSIAAMRPVAAAFAASIGAFGERGADVLLMLNDNPHWLFPDRPAVIRTVDSVQLLDRCGVGPRDALVLVVDRSQRVALLLDPVAGADAVAACLACLDDLPHEPPRAVVQPAPLVMIPNLLPRALCRTLIERFETSEVEEGKVARVDAAGKACNVVDHTKKSRRDLLIRPDDALHEVLRGMLLRRCAPEIAKAFQGHVAHLDRILVSRYDAGAGWFRRHRDNAADNVAFRQFALSVNLNTGDYEGGDLLFPEYNDHRYSPPAGGGLLFSTVVLHEAAPVTAGHRYVLLTFLHSDAAELRRQAYLARTALAMEPM